MLKRNHTLLVFIIMSCIVSSFTHGMKRNADIEYSLENCVLPANGESLPQEILEQIFTHVCDTAIKIPISGEERKQVIFEHNSDFWLIFFYGKLAQSVVMRSICKQWYSLLNPSEIKRRLRIDTDAIVHDLDKIKVTGNRKNFSYTQFLAQMIKNQINYEDTVCDHILKNDPDKLEIFLEAGLADLKYTKILISERRYNKIYAIYNKIDRCVFVTTSILGFMFLYGFFCLLYENWIECLKNHRNA